MRIAHLGHAELRTPKLEESVQFFKNVLGLEETERTGQSVYMRAWGDWEHHTLVLTAADRPGLEHVGWRVGAPEDVEAFAKEIEARGEKVTRVEAGTEKGQGDAIRFTYPGGQTMELYYDVEKFQPGDKRSRLKNAPQKPSYRGVGVRRLDHINMLSSDVTKTRTWLQDVLGFHLRENLYFDDQVEGASWLSVTSQVHDIAVMQDGTGQNGRLHHLAYWLDNREDVLRAADILTDAGTTIEAGPGKHGITQAFFIYLLEPGGNRIELFSGGYQIFAPDWEPITWTKDEIEKSIIWWGSPLPQEFFIYGT